MRDMGGRPPQALCGRSQLYRSMKAGRASALPASLSHALPYCHSCASVLFIRSALPFCQGLKGLV